MMQEKKDRKIKVVLFGSKEEVCGLTPQQRHQHLLKKIQEAIANTSENLLATLKHLEK